MTQLRLGKRPATHDDRDLYFARYTAALPAPPAAYGHQALVKKAWGMLGNDEWGDCAWAGPAHETMLLTAEAGKPTTFTTANVLSDYATGTGFNPNLGPPGDNPSDQGSDVRDVLTYRAERGIIDAHGTRHRIGAFVKLNHRSLLELRQAMSIFTTIGIGIQVPASAQQQFANHEPWTVVPGYPIEGGHYVPLVAYDAVSFTCVTWGQLQVIRPAFLTAFLDEAWAYISEEDLKDGRTIDGFNLTQLRADLAALPKEA